MIQRLLQLKFQVLKGMRVRFRLSEVEKDDFREFAQAFLATLQSKRVSSEWRAVSQHPDALL